MRMRALAVSSSLCLAGLVVTGCGSDPAIQADGAPAPAPETAPETAAAGGPDLSTAAFVDLTGASAPQVDALDNVFKAKFVEVVAGTDITFRNDGHNTHNLLPVVDGAFAPVEAGAFEPGASATVTFDQPGDYAYYCSLHGTTTKGMVGAVRVLE
ncbi:MAG: putative blue copper protein [Acidimicrobiales bacterium]|nr:putative blue copper protein [Acidimicrobiales bacterium]